MKLLSALITFLAIASAGASTAEAALRFVPQLVYEPFHRQSPEHAGVIRLGGGLRMIAETLLPRFAAEVEGLYANETTAFASENVLKETMFRGRVGVNVRAFDLMPLVFNVRGGFQFNVINDTYIRKYPAIEELNHYRHSTAYTGAEVELIPVAGFGILAGATISGHEPLNKWIMQYYLGIVLQ